jgi:cbb3-type cytochrome oxidase subunit 3
MFRDYIAATGLGGLHLIAMVVFFIVFVAVLAHTFLDREAQRRFTRAARLPFEDGEGPAPGTDERGAAR